MSESVHRLPLRFLTYSLLGINLLSMDASAFAVAADCSPGQEDSLSAVEAAVGPWKIKPAGSAEDPNKDVELKRIVAKQAQAERQRQEKQLEEITEKLREDADDAELWLLRASLNENLGNRQAAISDLTEVIEIQGSSAETLIRRGYLWQKENKFKKAEDDMNMAVMRDPHNAETSFAEGKMYLEQWRPIQAQASFNRAIGIDPKHHPARYCRAYVILGSQHDPQALEIAKEDLSQVIQHDPDNLLARYHHARALFALRDYAAAAEEATYVLNRDPSMVCMYRVRAVFHSEAGKYESAIADATKYIELSPDKSSAAKLRATIFFEMHAYAKSIEDWDKYLAANPKDVNAYYYRGVALENTRRFSEAAANWTKAIELEPENADWFHYRAFAKWRSGQNQDALADLTAGIDLAPNDSDLYATRAFIYRNMHEFAKARVDQLKMKALEQGKGRAEKNQLQEITVKKQLATHTTKMVAKLLRSQPLSENDFQESSEHEAWGELWLNALTLALRDSQPDQHERLLQGFRSLAKYTSLNPLPPEETKQAQEALADLAADTKIESLQNEANIISRVLGVLSEVNDPSYTASSPDEITQWRFRYPSDESGRPGIFIASQDEFIFWDEYKNWRENANIKRWGRFRELKRTSEFVELFDTKRGLWIRLAPTEAKWSFDHENWELVGKGQFVDE